MNYDELEAGLEMNTLVAKAMGYEKKGDKDIEDYWECPVAGFIGNVTFDGDKYDPSNDLNQAVVFAAAFTESFTLFSPTKTSPYWLCSSIAKGVKATSLGKAATPSLAICRSVLKMLEGNKQ